jgi:hypothetical protein
MTMLDRVMFAGLWLAALATAVLTLRTTDGPQAVLALAPLLGVAFATSLHPSLR